MIRVIKPVAAVTAVALALAGGTAAAQKTRMKGVFAPYTRAHAGIRGKNPAAMEDGSGQRALRGAGANLFPLKLLHCKRSLDAIMSSGHIGFVVHCTITCGTPQSEA